MRSRTLISDTKQLKLSAAELNLQIRRYLASLVDHRPETRGTYQRALRQFAQWIKDKPRFAFRIGDIEDYKMYLSSERHLSPVSISTYLTALRRLCGYLVSKSIIATNPAAGVGGSKRPSQHSRTPLSYNEVEALLKAIDRTTERGRRDYAMMKLILSCGLSAIEIVRADIQDLRQRNGSSILLLQGKGRTGKDEEVQIPDGVSHLLIDYLEERKDRKSTDPIFLSAGNRIKGKRMSTRGINQRINYYLKLAGIKQGQERRVTQYSLRHTAAIMLVDAGATPEEIQQRFRIGSMRTAMIYVNQKGILNQR